MALRARIPSFFSWARCRICGPKLAWVKRTQLMGKRIVSKLYRSMAASAVSAEWTEKPMKRILPSDLNLRAKVGLGKENPVDGEENRVEVVPVHGGQRGLRRVDGKADEADLAFRSESAGQSWPG